MNMKLGILASAALVLASTAHAGDFMAADYGNPALNKAGEAYLAGDFGRMAVELKNAIEAQPNDALVTENAIAMLNKAYEIRSKDGIPADWHLPDEIIRMKIGIRLTQKEIPEYSFKVFGNATEQKLFKQLRVVRFPDHVVVDKLAGVGQWEEEPGRNGDGPEFGLEGARSRQPIPAGLYLLKVELTNGKTADGWFLVDSQLNSTATAEVSSPAEGETFRTGNPTFRWADFRSPQYRPSENRSLWMGITRCEPPNYEWDLKWDLWENNPTLQEVTVGESKEGTGVSKLDKGRYMLILKYNERRRFGDLIIGRDSASVRHFSVQ